MGNLSIPVEVYIALPYVIAFSLPLVMALLCVLQYKFGNYVSPDTRLKVAVFTITIGSILMVALTPRTLNENDLALEGRVFMSDYDDGFSASRYISIFLVGASFVELIRGWVASRAVRIFDPARPILVGLLLFYLGTILIHALGSENRAFSYKSLYVPILLLAVYYQKVIDLNGVLNVIKVCILALTASSLIAIFVKPDFVMLRPWSTIIPGVDFRLFGLSNNPNALGPIALVAILIEVYSPSRVLWFRLLNVGSAFAVLVLAQSKTAWAAVLVMIFFVWIPLRLRVESANVRDDRQFQRAISTMIMIILFCIAIGFYFIFSGVSLELDKSSNLRTLTGRTEIWEITLEAWRENMVFGYGRDIWGPERMRQFGLFHVGQAHNQFIQTLGEAGLVGFVALMVLLGSLTYASLKRFAASRGITFAIFILIIVRCVTEAPLRADSVLSWPTLTLAILVLFGCYFLRMNTDVDMASKTINKV
jgi:exopolysaccharide production protein ExoQ